MEFRVLQYFLEISEKGNISKAAEAMRITQPTLSRQLKELEEELGTDLFIRTNREMVLTEDGSLLKNRAEDILELKKQLDKEFEGRKNQLLSGNISIGCVEADNSDTVAMILEELISDHPQVTFHIYSGTSDEITEKLDRGLINLAILLNPISVSKYDSFALPRKEHWGLLVSRESFLSNKEIITAEDIAGVPLLISRRQEVQEMLTQWGNFTLDELKIVGTYNLIFNVFSLVENRVGMALAIEGSVINRKLDSLDFIPLYPEITTNCVLIWRKNRPVSPLMHEVIQRFKSLVNVK